MQELCNEVPYPIEESEGGKMTEIEQLRADLQMLEAVALMPGMRPKTYEQIIVEIDLNKQRIAALEAEQAIEPDPWEEAKKYVEQWKTCALSNQGRTVADYVQHLEATIERDTLAYGKLAAQAAELLKERNEARAELAKLDEELRCERIDGGKVRDDLRAELAKRPVLESADALLQEMERHKAATADYLREKLAELTTIYNAIPPACPDAQALVKARIEGVKKEMQGNE